MLLFHHLVKLKSWIIMKCPKSEFSEGACWRVAAPDLHSLSLSSLPNILSLPRFFIERICNSLNAFSLPLFQDYSLLFLIYCTCLVAQETLDYQTTIWPTFPFCKNFIFDEITKRLCSLAVSLLIATILPLLSNNLQTAWLCLFFFFQLFGSCY